MLYRQIKTGKLYRWLAYGTDETKGRSWLPVAVYCPHDDEHAICVMDRDQFYMEFATVEKEVGDAPKG